MESACQSLLQLGISLVFVSNVGNSNLRLVIKNICTGTVTVTGNNIGKT